MDPRLGAKKLDSSSRNDSSDEGSVLRFLHQDDGSIGDVDQTVDRFNVFVPRIPL